MTSLEKMPVGPTTLYGEMNGGRGAGKTHKMLTKAVEFASIGLPCVLIFSRSREFDWAHHMLEKMSPGIQWVGLDMGRLGPGRGFLKFITPTDREFVLPGALRGYPHDTHYFWDHHAIEDCIRRALSNK